MSKNVQLLKPTNDYVFKRIFSYEGKENITKDFSEIILTDVLEIHIISLSKMLKM